MRLILALLFVAACGKHDNAPSEPRADEAVAAKVALYTSLASDARDYFGAIMTDRCDSWHFTALQGAVIGGVDPGAFVDQDGKLHRRPLVGYQECYPEGSASESAKEMYVYGALYAVARKDLAWAQARFDYGAHHKWIMGRGPVSRTLLLPAARAVLAQAIDELGGEKYPDRLVLTPRGLGLTDYEGFAEAVGITFEGHHFDAVSDASVRAADDLAQRNPRNVMYQCVAARWGHGDREAANALLLDPTIFPNDRLPTSADHCEPWLTQREDSDSGSWNPCPDEGKTHPPGAFLLAAAVCAGTI
jgi:hypothetical protein